MQDGSAGPAHALCPAAAAQTQGRAQTSGRRRVVVAAEGQGSHGPLAAANARGSSKRLCETAEGPFARKLKRLRRMTHLARQAPIDLISVFAGGATVEEWRLMVQSRSSASEPAQGLSRAVTRSRMKWKRLLLASPFALDETACSLITEGGCLHLDEVGIFGRASRDCWRIAQDSLHARLHTLKPCQDFAPTRRSGSRFMRVLPEQQAQRLQRLLQCERFAARFAHIDMAEFPGRALEANGLWNALLDLPNLKVLRAPTNGWSAPAARRTLLDTFRRGGVDVILA